MTLALLASLPLLALPQEALPRLELAPGPEGRQEGRVVLVRADGGFLDFAPRFLQAMTASGVEGKPVCLLVEEELSPAQVDLLNRLAPSRIESVGEPPASIAAHVTRRVEHPGDLFGPGPEAVVTSLHYADMLEAAPEAYRRGVPLLFARADGSRGAGLAGELERLGVRKVWVVASRQAVGLPDSIDRVDLSDPGRRWAELCREIDEPYLALANGQAGRSWATGAPLGGALLAAAHRGMLLAIDEPVEFHYATLAPGQRPEGLEESAAERWLVGEFEIHGEPRRVAVPQVGVGLGVGGFVPRWGDPLVDTDDDGTLDPVYETVVIGETCRLGEREFSISLRAIGGVGVTKFVDGQRVDRAVAVTPPAEALARRLGEIYAAGRLPAALLIVGDHREIPFDYVKDPVYAASMMHEQELASDNLYADPDDDGYLDLAVGRLISSSPVQASTIASRLASYPNWPAPESSEACLIYPAWAEDEARLGAPTIFANFEAFLRGLELDLGAVGVTTHLQVREAGDLDRVLPLLPDSGLILFAHHSGPDRWMFRIELDGQALKIDSLSPASAGGGRAVPFLRAAPLIVGAGCDSAGLDFEVAFEDSIVHEFLEQGAVAYIGNTRAGFPDTEEFLLRHVLQSAIGMAPGAPAPLSLGEAFRSGKNYLDLLIAERGPFVGVAPFQDYALAMRREWISLVLYGDPAMRLALTPAQLPRADPTDPSAPGVQVSLWPGGEPRIRIRFDGATVKAPVLITKQVGVGPVVETTAIVAAGLSYGSVPWATFADTRLPGPVGPGLYLDLELPEGLGKDLEVKLVSGPAWSLGGWRVFEDARGRRRLAISIDLVRYAMARPEEAVTVREVVLELSSSASEDSGSG